MIETLLGSWVATHIVSKAGTVAVRRFNAWRKQRRDQKEASTKALKWMQQNNPDALKAAASSIKPEE